MTSAARQQATRAAASFRQAPLLDGLLPFPGRAEASARMVLACLLIITLSMALQIPSAALSAYMVFFVSREDMATTTITGIALIVAVTVGIALSIFAFMLSINQPALRVALMALLFGLGMYISRIFVAGALGFGLGLILLVTLATVDLFPGPEALVRGTLWIWVALVFSIAVVVIVNVLVLPARPLQLLRQEVMLRLDFIAGRLASLGAGNSASPVLPAGAVRALDMARLQTLMKLAGRRDAAFTQRMPAYAAAVAALAHLVEAACMLDMLPSDPPSPQLQARLARLREACGALKCAVADPDTPWSAPLPLAQAGLTAPADRRMATLLVTEMEHGIEEIHRQWQAAQSGASAAATMPPPPPSRPFVADALSNPAHMQFALKVTFAAMLCYILYTAVSWPGIHTCVITCAVVALTTSGATIHKSALRIAGALTGGALALLATVFIVPHLESIGGLLLLMAPVMAVSAWISAGSERTAYFGWQLAFAFLLCILHDFQPSSDVTLVRDRLVGIVLGIVVMGLVFQYVWPEHATEKAATILARVLRNCAQLLQRPGGMTREELLAGRAAVLQDLRGAERLAEAAAFELLYPEQNRVESLGAAVHAAALSSLQLVQLQADGGAAVDDDEGAALAAALAAAADCLETGSPQANEAAEVALASLAELERVESERGAVASDVAEHRRAALNRSHWLLQVVRA
jgi:multidrug resistance protein MdtO